MFKVLTGLNLFITGFFLLLILMSMLMGGLAQGLISGIMFGGIFIHSILSVYLQRSLQEPTFVLKESTPGGIRIMGGFSILMGVLLLLGAIAMSAYRQEYIQEITRQMTDEQQELMLGMIGKLVTGMQIFLVVYGTIIVINAVLSLSFLQQWKNRQDNKNIDLDLDA
jgi:hypothetical protein